MYFYVWSVRVYAAHTVSSIVISGVPGVFSERATFLFFCCCFGFWTALGRAQGSFLAVLRGPFGIPGWPRARPIPYRCSIPAAPTCDILLRHHPHLETNVVAVLFWSPGLSDLPSAAVAEMFCFILFFGRPRVFSRVMLCVVTSTVWFSRVWNFAHPFPVLFPSTGRAMPPDPDGPSTSLLSATGIIGGSSCSVCSWSRRASVGAAGP